MAAASLGPRLRETFLAFLRLLITSTRQVDKMTEIKTFGGIRFDIAPEVENILVEYLRTIPIDGPMTPCLVSAGPKNQGFIIGSHELEEILAVPRIDEFIFRERRIYLVITESKKRQLSGSTLIAGKEFFEIALLYDE